MQMTELPDNGERRSGRDRRSFLYALNIPEMRSGKERRSGFDKRKEARYEIYKLSKSNGVFSILAPATYPGRKI